MDEAILSRLCGQSGAAAPVRAGLQFGQLLASGGAAPSGASLDIDDVAGETDQDWCEGRASFPEDRLSDGGSGGATRVVPDDFGTDWPAEITSSSNRLAQTNGRDRQVAPHPLQLRPDIFHYILQLAVIELRGGGVMVHHDQAPTDAFGEHLTTQELLIHEIH